MYDSTPLYDQSSLEGLEADIRTVAATWFGQEAHDCVGEQSGNSDTRC
jgi:hypothetical protein